MTQETMVNVRAYGANGDGAVDDAPAIQRALESGAALVCIPAGRYRIGTTLCIRSQTTLRVDPTAHLFFADGAGRDRNDFLLTNADHAHGNQDVTVEGGIWDGNSPGNPRGEDGNPRAYTGVALNFINVTGLTLRGLTVRNPESFFIRLGETVNFLLEDIAFDQPILRPNQDGIHVGGGCRHGVIRRVRGLTPNTPNDDMIALNADDDVERAINLGMIRGPISDIVVEEIEADGSYNFVRLLSVDAPLERITIRGVRGTCRFYAVNMNNWRFAPGVGQIRDITLEDFDVAKTEVGDWHRAHIDVALAVRNLHIRRYHRRDDCPEALTLLLRNGHSQTGTTPTATQQVATGDDFILATGGIADMIVTMAE